ncbi:unnamed protein product, partial [Scytosiphon promiscuus]
GPGGDPCAGGRPSGGGGDNGGNLAEVRVSRDGMEHGLRLESASLIERGGAVRRGEATRGAFLACLMAARTERRPCAAMSRKLCTVGEWVSLLPGDGGVHTRGRMPRRSRQPSKAGHIQCW